MISIGLKEEENCLKVYIENDGKIDNIKMCVDGGEDLRSQIYLVYFAKKIATDCVRYKDKLNDMQSIQKINDQIEFALLEKRQSIEDVDGNR